MAPPPGEAAGVAAVVIGATGACLFATHRYKGVIQRNRIVIPYFCLLYSVTAVVATAAVVAKQTNPSTGLFTTTTWFTAGWNTSLSVFSIRIDTAWKYTVVVLYQIIRSFLGSLVVNYFRSFLLTEIQSKAAAATRTYSRTYIAAVMGAQFSYNVFSFYSALTDSYLMLSQADLTGLTAAITILADGQSTINLMMGDAPVATSVDSEKTVPLTAPDFSERGMTIEKGAPQLYMLKSL